MANLVKLLKSSSVRYTLQTVGDIGALYPRKTTVKFTTLFETSHWWVFSIHTLCYGSSWKVYTHNIYAVNYFTRVIASFTHIDSQLPDVPIVMWFHPISNCSSITSNISNHQSRLSHNYRTYRVWIPSFWPQPTYTKPHKNTQKLSNNLSDSSLSAGNIEHRAKSLFRNHGRAAAQMDSITVRWTSELLYDICG